MTGDWIITIPEWVPRVAWYLWLILIHALAIWSTALLIIVSRGIAAPRR